MRRVGFPVLVLLSSFLPALCQTQVAPHVFADPPTGAITRFPGELALRDPDEVVASGHLRAFGSMQNEAKAHELSLRCIKPLIVADLPSGSETATPAREARLMLFDFSLAKECTAGFKYQEDERVAGGVAQAFVQIPGGKPIGPPLWFEWGTDRLHLYVVAFGENPKSPALVAVATILWKGHVLGWMLTADSPGTFNGIGKVEVEVEPGRTYQLPFQVSSK